MLNNGEMNTQAFIGSYILGLKGVMETLSWEDMESIIDILADTYEQGKQIFIVGNGGSAATASHLATDLSKTVLGNVSDPRIKRFAVIALTDNVSLMTAWANDVSYEVIFAEQLKNLAHEGDLLIAISASGNSLNIVEAVKAAKHKGLRSIGLLGFEGGSVKELLDQAVVARTDHYGHIEDLHMMIAHLITAYFKEAVKPTQEKATLTY